MNFTGDLPYQHIEINTKQDMYNIYTKYYTHPVAKNKKMLNDFLKLIKSSLTTKTTQKSFVVIYILWYILNIVLSIQNIFN